MREELLGYLVGALDPHEHREVEENLRTSPDLRRVLDEMRSHLQVLSWDAIAIEPPADLARKTSSRIAQHSAILPIGEYAGRSPRWSLTDMLVAASILAAATMLFVPAVGHSRAVAKIAGCQNNLRQIASALFQYSDRHGGYAPVIEPQGKLATSSAFAPRLVAAGMLPDTRVLSCPDSPQSHPTPLKIPPCDAIARMNGSELATLHDHMGGDYRSTIGYVGKDGLYHPTRNQRRPWFAYLADAPHSETDRQSLNHGRRGQNVLFEDGHAAFLKTCRCTPDDHPDDIYLNADGKVAPGISPDDSVIPPGSFQLPPGMKLSPELQITPVHSN